MKRHVILVDETGELVCGSNSLERARQYAEEYLRTASDGTVVALYSLTESAVKTGVVWSNGKASVPTTKEKRRWTEEEVARLRELFDKGLSDLRIGVAMNRTAAAIHAKLYKLGLSRDRS